MSNSPKYTQDQINDLVYTIDKKIEEIQRQEDWFKEYGSIATTFFKALSKVQSKIWLIVLLGIAGGALGLSL